MTVVTFNTKRNIIWDLNLYLAKIWVDENSGVVFLCLIEVVVAIGICTVDGAELNERLPYLFAGLQISNPPLSAEILRQSFKGRIRAEAIHEIRVSSAVTAFRIRRKAKP